MIFLRLIDLLLINVVLKYLVEVHVSNKHLNHHKAVDEDEAEDEDFVEKNAQTKVLFFPEHHA